jgi:hypothetical protein
MTGFALQTVFEVFLVVAVFWGIFNENKLIVLEKRLFAAIRRRRLRVVKAKRDVDSFRVIKTGN